ncbi:uncharacterized protein HMPREF1541_02331 [Cyphellophora europaea CBS 101466]|uniref:Uncharacterized protein n=1 Tax=Cyphellophora europaea (strain CBS 101466) TaxID=1220924 RepID=W2S549_CYPE1|nr:uncharacterized protein HMPREF1541_02331 [Cyphellophora europaea CBS 101466]ETN43173.1 hypothetical protein HMPREF1541_02331 [Cyphellophora europaea CBS 101466]
MRETNAYTSKHYRRDNGFPLVWMLRCCLGRATKGSEEEADEHFERSAQARQGKIIGRPAGRTAFIAGKDDVRLTTTARPQPVDRVERTDAQRDEQQTEPGVASSDANR